MTAINDTENPHKNTGLTRILKAGIHSYHGLCSALKHEAAFRQEVMFGILLVSIAVYLDVPPLEKAVMIASIFIVFMVELLNSAIEWATDYISLERHPYAKRIKDMGSAAVLLSLFNVAITWGIILYPHYTQ